jgi:hypothetical protein
VFSSHAPRQAGLQAEAFVDAMAEIETARRLDPLADLLLQHGPFGPDDVRSLATSMGAFVGELLVRNGGARWSYDIDHESPAVRLPSGIACFPLNKVSKRLTVGPEHSIAQFVEVAMSGVIPPRARPLRRLWFG